MLALTRFYLLSCLFTWSCWIPQIIFQRSLPFLTTIGTFGPLLSALVCTNSETGKNGLRNLLRPLLNWRHSFFWYAFALLGTAALLLPILWFCAFFPGVTLTWNDPSRIYLVIPVLLWILFFSVAGEETGWRGYALPLLVKCCGYRKAALLIGILWGIWHWPLFLIADNFHAELPFFLFVIQDAALSVVLTWIWYRTQRSLTIVHLFHAASNTTIGVLPILPDSTGGSMLPLYLAITGVCLLAVTLLAGAAPFRQPVKPATAEN